MDPRSLEGDIERRAGLLDPDALQRMTRQAGRLMQEEGGGFRRYPPSGPLPHLDPLPRIVPGPEWSRLAEGVAQRLEVWNRFLQDMHDGREALRAGILPVEWVYSDPAFLRAAVDLPVPGGRYLAFACLDVAQDPSGRWMVEEERFDRLPGVVQALRARPAWSQVYGELAGGSPPPPPPAWARLLHDRLRLQAVDGALHRQAALLSPASPGPHSFLARSMGIPWVAPDDLAVIDSRMHLKTVGGLEPIDVILRLVEDRNLDAVEFDADRGQGIPGLAMCVRKQTLSLCNALGSGLAANRLIGSRLDRMCRFYLGKRLILPTAERRWCRDPGVLAEALSRPGDWRALPLQGDPAPSDPLEELRRRPEAFVAQARVDSPRLPLRTSRGTETPPATLRLFAIEGRAGDMLPLSCHGGLGFKDTWIGNGIGDEPGPSPLPALPARRRISLSSRRAGHFLWLGRYLERAECALRGLRTLRQIQEEWPAHAPLLAPLAGPPLPTGPGGGSSPPGSPEQARAGTVVHSLGLGCENGQAVREILPPKPLAHLERLESLLAPDAPERPERDREEELMLCLDAFTGAMATHLARDQRWRFWRMGVALERALHTLAALRRIIEAEDSGGLPAAMALDALIRMVACSECPPESLGARRRWLGTVRKLIRDPELPRSLKASLSEVEEALGSVLPDPPRSITATQDPLSASCRSILDRIEHLDLEEAPAVLAWLDGRIGETRALSDRIADRCVHHQVSEFH